MRIILRRHGRAERFVAFDTETGEANPCAAPDRQPDGWAHRKSGTWYAGYRLDGAPFVQVGRARWSTSDVKSNVLERKGFTRRFALTFVGPSGESSVEVSYMRPLASYLDDPLDGDDATSSDFFVWLHRAIKEKWLDRWGEVEGNRAAP